LVIALSAGATSVANASDSTSQWIYPGPDGKLVYKTTATGDKIMDFSYAGYMGGGVPIPDVPVKQTVKPSGSDDDTAAIQAAIDAVSALPLVDGFRGAVQLAPGTFSCSQPIQITKSGVVLRGSGSSAADKANLTTIKLTGRPHLAVRVSTGGGRRGTDNTESATPDSKSAETTIADKYVPAGSTTFQVADASQFAAGDTISIRRPVTPAWVALMHMDDLVRDGKGQTWIRAGTATLEERTIKSISGNQINVDVPLSDSFDATYLSPPGTSVVKIRPPARLSQVGIENLHIECPPQAINHTEAHFQALRVSGEDCWARNLRIDETMNSVSVSGRRITLQNVSVNRQAKHQGSSKPAEFAPNGSQVLIDRCSVTGDNIWFTATGAGVSGPIVLLNCTFHGNGAAESHQRWSTGILYDNCQAPEGDITMRNRGSMGSGHGWTMGWGVLWNCTAKDFIVQNPPGADNWMIGCTGPHSLAPRPFGKGPDLPEGIIDSQDNPVTPRSLYLTQLSERLGPQALKNIGY
jgi:hypothetical protein